MPADLDRVRERLGDPRRDRADSGFGDQLHGHPGGRVDALQIVDELRQVLDAVDVVVGRRRDKRGAGLGAADPRDLGADLVARQLSTLPGLAALRHLDLELIGGQDVRRRDPEARRGDLLDPRVRPVAAICRPPVAGGLFPSLAAVRARADAVRGDGQCAVGLEAERAVRHRRDDEATHDALPRLHLLERYGGLGHELQQIPQGRGRTVGHKRGEGAVRVMVAVPRGPVEGFDHVRVEGVELTAPAEPDVPRLGEGRRRKGWRGHKCLAVPDQNVLGDRLRTDTADP